MDSTVVIGIIGLLVLLGAIAFFAFRRDQSQRLRERFGPEYERAVAERGDRRAAEQELASRERRRERLHIRALDPVMRDQYLSEWRAVQTRFVDEPALAVAEAHSLVKIVMRERGYPMDDFEQRAADISVDHPEVVEDYRVAHRVSRERAEGRATTEDLREAMIRYRSLFSRLLDVHDEAPRETTERRPQ